MNKKLLTAAIGAALVAGPMMVAQADVKLYGDAHVSVDVLDRSVSADQGDYFLASNSSLIGFSANEDLGGGLKAIFGYEATIALDQSAAPNGNRNMFVGLQGDWGAVRLGQYDTPLKQVGRRVDQFWSTQLGETRAITRQGSWDERFSNSVRYDSPSVGGFQGSAQYSFEDAFGNDFTRMGLGATFTTGPMWFGGAYETHDITTSTDETALRLAFEMKFGPALLGLLWQSVGDAGGVQNADRDTMGVGASFTAGNNVFKAQYYIADKTDGAAADDGATLMAIGLDHILSKSTTVYVQYAEMDNEIAGGFDLGGNGHGATADPAVGQDADGLSFGMRYKF